MKESLLLLLLFLVATAASAQERPRRGSLEWYRNGPQKNWSAADHEDYYRWRERVREKMLRKAAGSNDNLAPRQRAIINGNKITTEIWNYGSISSPGNRTTDIVWEGLGYGYEFAPFIAAEIEVPPRSHRDAYIKRDAAGNPVIKPNGDTMWVAICISDGLISNGGEVSPDGKEFWGWEPLASSDDGRIPYANPQSNRIPTVNDLDRDGDGKPDSWPDGWYNPNLKRYVWPGALRQGASNADMESFFVCDDRRNKEFQYYPFVNDSTRRGLGLEVEFRYYQWSNPLAEDIIFLIYKITNKSDKDLHNVYFGMWGDPHIGGPSNWQDDLSFFDRSLNMVYSWDEDGKSDVAGRAPGYFGYKFLESPGNPLDGIDNDNDGYIDESQTDGLDNDGDWVADKHDVGVDGVPNTGDRGEGDGVPTAGDPFDIREPGEPNFEFTDLDESDQIGLTSFAAPPFGGQNVISADEYIFRNYMTAGKFDSANATQAGDYVFLYGSGPIELPAKAIRRFSIALLVGQDLEDLLLNAQTAQQIYEINYQFAKPPEKPTVTAVPGDRKVTLYWDNVAESSFDPVSEKFDFEGYVIYRSTDPNFLDQQVITDANGTRFLFEPLKTVTGAPARFDLVNEYSGLSTVPYPGRGVSYYLGNNSGLRHAFIDSNNVINGQTYYYAVVAYDHGDVAQKIAPTECSKNITLNPESNELILDVNTVRVVPRAPSAGYVVSALEDNGETHRITHRSGVATGTLKIEIVDPRAVEDNNEFHVRFATNPVRYSVEDMKPVIHTFNARVNQFVRMPHLNVNDTTFVLTTADGRRLFTRGTDYELQPEAGFVRVLPGGAISESQALRAVFRYFAIKDSRLLNFEEANPFFDGMRLFVQDVPLNLDASRSGWTSTSKSNYLASVKPFNGVDRNKYPADYEIRFFNTIVDSSARPGFGFIKSKIEVWEVTRGRIPKKQRMVYLETVKVDSLWTPNERAVILLGDQGLVQTWEFTFQPPSSNPVAPAAGDVYFIATSRPFTAEDVYSFKTKAAHVDEALAANSLDRIRVVPNPYVVTNIIEPLDRQNPRDRGERRLYFDLLPKDCTIRIFTVTGELVDILEHHSTIDNGQAFWNLTTRDNFPLAYGIYLYHVDAGPLGQKIGRFAVIK
ncbi:MAG: hypothetical protein ONB49_11560 [candidate division KSB1 bacterium]|nr:hypothetical protein [candidate division KSB1 bacterium]MDZ7353076.1 hypothetical protein [candidate division KSB1 bacterium]